MHVDEGSKYLTNKNRIGEYACLQVLLVYNLFALYDFLNN